MNNKERVVFEALRKAHRNGFNCIDIFTMIDNSSNLPNGSNLVLNALSINPFGIIYQPGFLKAFFKEEKSETARGIILLEAWQLHARQMVTCEDPLSYLEKFLEIPPRRSPLQPLITPNL